MRVLLLCLWLTTAASAQTQVTTLNVPLGAGTLSIRNVGVTTHAFVPTVGVRAQAMTNVPLTLQSAPVFSISNIGGTAGWSVTLSETHPGNQNLSLDYLPGSGPVTRTVGSSADGDLNRDAALAGGALSTGRKVLSAPANTNMGVFQYTLSTTGWQIPLVPANTGAGTYSWTLQATLASTP